MITNQGIDHFLGSTLSADTQVTTWYLGLIKSTSFTAIDASDTMSSHSGWQECTDYAEGTRPTWSDGGAGSGHISNPAGAAFTMTADATIIGTFLTSNSTKGGTTGTLLSVALNDEGNQAVTTSSAYYFIHSIDALNG